MGELENFYHFAIHSGQRRFLSRRISGLKHEPKVCKLHESTVVLYHFYKMLLLIIIVIVFTFLSNPSNSLQVKGVELQRIKYRQKKSVAQPTDPLWEKQWQLVRIRIMLYLMQVLQKCTMCLMICVVMTIYSTTSDN